jgi:hypothetical protein
MNVNSGVWKPTSEVPSKKIAGSCEVTNLSLKAGNGAAVVSFYDGSSDGDAVPANLKWVLDASTTSSDNERFDGLVFKKGVFAVCEQGVNFNPIVLIATKKYNI